MDNNNNESYCENGAWGCERAGRSQSQKDGKLIVWGIIIGLGVASAWRWVWDVITWGMNHNWREHLSKILNVTCVLSRSILAALPGKGMSKSTASRYVS
jgi:hypothetical protein